MSETNSFSLTNVINTAIQVPGVKVNRESFLMSTFAKESDEIKHSIIEFGPVHAGIDRERLYSIAKRLVYTRTITTSVISFAAGLPGGLAMAATIPADVLQFFAIALRLAQELSYLYDGEDLWKDGQLDIELVTGNLVIYCGVMFGVSGANAAIRALSSAIGKQVIKKLPQKALTKTFYYPIVKAIAKAIGARMTKEIFSKGVAKAIPIIGGVLSGGITFISMRPMGMKLLNEFDQSLFEYNEEDFNKDWENITGIDVEAEEVDTENIDVNGNGVDTEEEITFNPDENVNQYMNLSPVEQINEAKELLQKEIITPEEFEIIKKDIFGKIGNTL